MRLGWHHCCAARLASVRDMRDVWVKGEEGRKGLQRVEDEEEYRDQTFKSRARLEGFLVRRDL